MLPEIEMLLNEVPRKESIEKATNESPSGKDSVGKKCYTIDEIAIILGICRKSVCALLKKNEFRWFKIGREYRISKQSFDEWLNENTF